DRRTPVERGADRRPFGQREKHNRSKALAGANGSKVRVGPKAFDFGCVPGRHGNQGDRAASLLGGFLVPSVVGSAFRRPIEWRAGPSDRGGGPGGDAEG